LTSDTPAPSFKPFRSQVATGSALIQANSNPQALSLKVAFLLTQALLRLMFWISDFRWRCSVPVQDQVGSEFEVLPSGCQMARVGSPGLGFGRFGIFWHLGLATGWVVLI
jgi:hypothetical protein